ncbi:MAG: AsmA family protein [Usitatibacter sp.]
MTKWRKTAIWALAIAVLAVAAGAFALPRLVDPDRLKRVARDKAAAAWSRELSIGDVTLTFLPMPAHHAERVALANPAWANSRQLFTAESVDARLALLPLLLGKVRVKSLDLDAARVNLETAPDGAKSWDLAAGANAKTTASADTNLMDVTEVTIRNSDVTERSKGATTLLHIEEANAQAEPGLRDVRIDARVLRNRRPATVKASFADLSGFGNEGATTEGRIDLDWGKSQLAVAGRLPIDAAMKGYAVSADLNAVSLHEMAAFFGDNRLPTAPAKAHITARESQGKVEVGELSVAFGQHVVTGRGEISRVGAKTLVNGRLESARVDWEKALLELGYPALPPLAPDELFHENPLGWPFLASLEGAEGTVDLKLGWLRIRNGVEMKNVKARAAFVGDRADVNPFSMELLGGSANGNLLLEGRKKALRLNFDGTHILLERWFQERGRKIPLTGGPMKIKATLSATGGTMKALAASVSGPVTIHMGPAVWSSEKAAHAQDVMASAFSGKNSASIDFECVGASLPFASGRASAKSIIGVSSTVSNLLTSGYVDFREETLELRGRVQPKAATVGLAAIAGDIRIGGKLRAPHASLDPVSTPGVIARGAAAIATLGLSAVGTAAARSAEARKTDPCELVFEKP